MNGNVELKKVKPMLVVGIVLLPIIFVWALLEEGYSVISRIIAFTYLIVGIIYGLAHIVFGFNLFMWLGLVWIIVSAILMGIFKDAIELDNMNRASKDKESIMNTIEKSECKKDNIYDNPSADYQSTAAKSLS